MVLKSRKGKVLCTEFTEKTIASVWHYINGNALKLTGMLKKYWLIAWRTPSDEPPPQVGVGGLINMNLS
jgi:hypothetical protein